MDIFKGLSLIILLQVSTINRYIYVYELELKPISCSNEGCQKNHFNRKSRLKMDNVTYTGLGFLKKVLAFDFWNVFTGFVNVMLQDIKTELNQKHA